MSPFDSALRLIRTIERYWADRGYTVEPRLVAVQGNKCLGTEHRYEIHSDMLNGWPRQLAERPPRAYEEKPGEFQWEQRGNTMVNVSVTEK